MGENGAAAWSVSTVSVLLAEFYTVADWGGNTSCDDQLQLSVLWVCQPGNEQRQTALKAYLKNADLKQHMLIHSEEIVYVVSKNK